MNKIKLLCMSAAVATTLLFSPTVSADTVQPIQQSLNIDAAINMAIQNSYSIKKIDIGIQQAQNNYNDAVRAAAGYSAKVPYTEGDTKLQLIKARDFTQLEYKYAIFQYTNIKEVAKNQITFTVYQAYSAFVTVKEALDLEQQNFNNVEQQYNKAKLQLSLGTASPVDVKASEASYTAEKAKLNQLKRQYDTYVKQLNQILGVDINTGDSQYVKYIPYINSNIASVAKPKTYDEYVKDALTNRIEIRNDNENINLRKSEFNSVRSAFPYNYTAQYKIYKYPVDTAQNKLDTDKIDISIEINTLYNDLQDKIKSLEPAKKDYTSAKRTYDIAAQNYNLGLISKIDYDKAEINLKSKENSIKTIERNIWLAQKKLDYASNLGVDATSLASSAGN